MTQRIFDLLVLSGAASILGIMVAYWHLSKATDFDLRWLFVDTETKKVSLFKVGQFAALCLSSWVLVRETSHDRLSEWLYASYMLTWGGVNIANRIISKPTNTPKETI